MFTSTGVPPAHRHLSLQPPGLQGLHTDNQGLLHGAEVLRGTRNSYSGQGLW